MVMGNVSAVALPEDAAEYFVEYTQEKYDLDDTDGVALLAAPDEVVEEIDELLEESDLGNSGPVARITVPGGLYESGGEIDYEQLKQDVEEALEYGEKGISELNGLFPR